jgi:Tol biopolymer transport system component
MPVLTASIVSRLRTSGASRTRAVWLALALAVAAPTPQALAQAAAQPAVRPAAKPAAKPATKPAVKPATKPAVASPVIDRELFFGDPEYSGAQISPDGKYIAFIKPFKGTRNIWVKLAGEPFAKAKPISADTKRPVRQYFWSRDAKYVLFVQDQGGDENFNVYAVDPAAAPAAGADVPAARNITEAKAVRAAIYHVSKVDPDLMFVGLNDRDAAWHDLYRVRISTGERTLLRKNTDRIAGWEFDLKDQLRLAARTTDKGDTEVLRVDESSFTKVYECSVFETCGTVRFHKDGQRVYMETNKGTSDLTR